MNPFNWMLQAQMSRYNMPGAARSSTSAFNDYANPGYDDDSYLNDGEVRRRAQNAARSALLSGLLSNMLSGEQRVDPYAGMRDARAGVLDRAREDQRVKSYDERQRRVDAEMQASRAAEIDNKRVDNERVQREADAKAAEADAKRKADEAERARIDAQRARLLKDNPDAVNYSAKQVDDEYAKRYGYHEPDKPQEISPGAYLRDPRTGEIIYHAPERADRDKLPTPAELRAQRSEEQRAIKARSDEFYDEWLAEQNPYRPPSDPAKAQARLEARRKAEREFGGDTPTTAAPPTPAVDPRAGARAIVGKSQATRGGSSVGSVGASVDDGKRATDDVTMPTVVSALVSGNDAAATKARELRAKGMSWVEIERLIREALGGS